MKMDWSELETSTHQDHVIKHVIGATILGWFVAGEAAHFLLDIGFLWTIYLDGEMNLLPQGVALSELDADDLTSADKAELALDADQLMSEGREARGLKRFTVASKEVLIERVEVWGADSRRQIKVLGGAEIVITTSLESSTISIEIAKTPDD